MIPALPPDITRPVPAIEWTCHVVEAGGHIALVRGRFDRIDASPEHPSSIVYAHTGGRVLSDTNGWLVGVGDGGLTVEGYVLNIPAEQGAYNFKLTPYPVGAVSRNQSIRLDAALQIEHSVAGRPRRFVGAGGCRVRQLKARS